MSAWFLPSIEVEALPVAARALNVLITMNAIRRLFGLTEIDKALELAKSNRWRKGERRVVIHYHLYKNAGSSIDEFLLDVVDSAWASFDTGPTDVLLPADAGTYLQSRPEITALSSHVLRPPAPDGFNVFPIALIRHPLDRALSVYSHARRVEPTYETARAARENGFADFMCWCLDHPNNGGVVLINYQVIHFSSASFRFPHIFQAVASEEDLFESVEFVDSLPCIGVVDQFDRYFARLQIELSGWLGRSLRREPPRANISPERPRLKLPEAVRQIERMLGPKLLRRFVEMNEFDYRLYKRAAVMAKSQDS